MSFWTPIENPGTRPPRSWVFDVGCAASAAMASFGSFSFAQTAHPAHPPLAVSLVVAVLTTLVLPLRRVWPGPVFGVVVLMAAVLAQWPVPGQLYPVRGGQGRVDRPAVGGIKVLLAFFIPPPVLAHRATNIDACAVLPGALSLRDPLSSTSAR